MDANSIAALLGLLLSASLSAYLAWEIAEGWRKGRFLMRGPMVVERQKHTVQFYASLLYKLGVLGLSLCVAAYAAGRLLGWWGAL
jgi:hypothetical protein